MHIANGLQALGSDGIRKVFFGRMSVAPEAGDARARAAHEPDPAVTIAALRADIIRMQTEMIESVNTILVDATARDAQLLSAIRAMQAVVVASQQARENMHDQRRQRLALPRRQRHDVPSGNVHVQVVREGAPDPADQHYQDRQQEYRAPAYGHCQRHCHEVPDSHEQRRVGEQVICFELLAGVGGEHRCEDRTEA